MSYTDPCARCEQHRADCDCKEGYLTCMPEKSETMTDKKELAEQILEKYFPHEYGEPFSYYERKSIIAAIIEAMGVQPGMRWVKASERLPEVGVKAVKVISKESNYAYGTGLFSNEGFEMATFLNKTTVDKYENGISIEWLEETPQLLNNEQNVKECDASKAKSGLDS